MAALVWPGQTVVRLTRLGRFAPPSPILHYRAVVAQPGLHFGGSSELWERAPSYYLPAQVSPEIQQKLLPKRVLSDIYPVAYLENSQRGTTSQEGAMNFFWGRRFFFCLGDQFSPLFFPNLIFIPKHVFYLSEISKIMSFTSTHQFFGYS